VAETHEEARSLVIDRLSDSEPRWSDWNEASGGNPMNSLAGRWAGENILGEKADNDTLRYSDDPETAEKAISTYIKHRYKDIEDYRNKLYQEGKQDILFSYNYDPEKSKWEPDQEMPLYYAKKLAELLNEVWTADSAIYDLEDWTTELTTSRSRIEIAPEKQFLVLVDFHF